MDVDPEAIQAADTTPALSSGPVAITDMEIDAAGTIPASSATVKLEDTDRWAPAEADGDNALAITSMAAGSAHGAGTTASEGIQVEPDSGARTEARADGTLRVSMGPSNAMPKFVVMISKYEDAVRFNWRSDVHIQMMSSEERSTCEVAG